jgi:hypothetical protein
VDEQNTIEVDGYFFEMFVYYKKGSTFKFILIIHVTKAINKEMMIRMKPNGMETQSCE